MLIESFVTRIDSTSLQMKHFGRANDKHWKHLHSLGKYASIFYIKGRKFEFEI